MSFNGSGTFLINTAGQPVVAGTVISSTAFNALTADLATGLSTVITKDGQTTVTANIPMSTYKFTGLGVGSAATDSANLSQVQSTVTKLLTSVSGTDTITAVGAPVVAAYAAGQMFYFVATGDNTGAVTLNIDSLGAKAVTRDGSVALAAGDIKSGEVVVVVYDGTRFQVVSQLNSAGDARFANVSIASSLYVGGVSTFVGNAGFSANVSIASALSVGGVAAITGATTIGGNLTLNGGTANGVLYLNGSKVATSGTALVFDGTNFGTTGNANLGSGSKSTDTQLNFASDLGTQRIYLDRGTRSLVFYDATTAIENYRIAGITGVQTWGVGGSEQMRLNSTGLGIGTSSPAYKLDVNGSTRATGLTANNSAISSGASQTTVDFLVGTAGRVIAWGPNASTAGTLYLGTLSSDASVGSTSAVILNSSGNLGLGVTPSAWGSGYKALEFAGGGALYSIPGSGNTGLVYNAYHNGTNWIYRFTVNAAYHSVDNTGFKWFNSASGTAGNAISFTQAMTLTAAGDLLVGTTTNPDSRRLRVYGIAEFDGAGISLNIYKSSGTKIGSAGQGDYVVTGGPADGYGIQSQTALVFGAGGTTERARITSGGYSKFSNDGTYVGSTGGYHELRVSGAAADWTTIVSNAVTTGANAYGVSIRFTGSTPNNTGNEFIQCLDATATRFAFRSNGGLANYSANDVNLSDERTKKDIVPLGSMWDKFKAIEIVAFKYKDQTHEDNNIGVIAQQVESVAPEFVDVDGFGDTPEDGVPLKTVYTTDMYHAAIKALQEAMTRIEQLEAKVAALESK